MKKKVIKYHYLTERIFATCGVYFKEEFKEQAKYEIEKLVQRFSYLGNLERKRQ